MDFVPLVPNGFVLTLNQVHVIIKLWSKVLVIDALVKDADARAFGAPLSVLFSVC